MTVLLSVAARGLSLVVALVCGVLSARLILGHAGVEYYALYALISTLPSLIAFSDLGAGAVVVNAAATSDDVRHDAGLRLTITSVGRIMLTFAAAGLVLDVLLLVSGGWALILGDAGTLPGAPACAFLALAIYCIAIPLGIWQRVLLGLRKNHVIIFVQLVQAPLTLFLVWVAVDLAGQAAFAYVAVATTAAGFVVAAIGFALVSFLTRPLLYASSRDVLRVRTVPGARVMDVGWPMLAQLLTPPLSLTMQRYILAQSASTTDVAIYAAAGQVFFALSGLVAAGGVTLWPAFARARERGEVTRGPWALSAGFAVAAAALCGFVMIVSPWLFSFTTSGRLAIPWPVLLWFSAMVVAQAALYPLGMFIMDKPGIRFQVAPALLMALSTVAVSVALTPALGVIGPLIANTAAVVVVQIVPFAVYIHQHRARLLAPSGRHEDAPVADGGVRR